VIVVDVLRAKLPHRMRKVSVKKQLGRYGKMMTPKDMRSHLVKRGFRGAGDGKNNASTAQCFPERLMERDAAILPSKEDIAMDTAAGDAHCVATMIATTSPKREECAGDMEQILRNASTILVTHTVRKDANSMRQKEGCVECIPDQNAVRKGVSVMH
jgi:hypothetical protein